MRRLVFVTIGILEVAVGLVLINFARHIPARADVEQSFQSAERITDRAETQVRLFRDQVRTLKRLELHQVSTHLQKQAEAITNTLRTQTVDFDAVITMRDAVGDLGKGLGELAATLDAASIGRLSDGLGETAGFLEEKLVPAARKSTGKSGDTTNSYRADSDEIKLVEKASTEPKAPVVSSANKGDKGSVELAHVLPEADRLKQAADALRQAQSGLDTIHARWPELQSRLKQLSTALKTTQHQLGQALDHRQDYEEAMGQTVQLADMFTLMLPLLTEQLDGRLDEEERTLTDLGLDLDEAAKALPEYALVTDRLFSTARILSWLLAAIVGLHGAYLMFGSILARPRPAVGTVMN